jgi:CRISPR-associated endonuclease/helicase Cas3
MKTISFCESSTYLNFKNLGLPKNIDNIFAHRKGSKKKETLEEHSNLTKYYLNLLVKNKNLSEIINSLLKNISDNNFNLLKRMFYNAIYLHDLGKTNPAFQRNKMDNKLFIETTKSSNHSLPSAKIYIELFKTEIEKIRDDEEYYRLIYVLYSFAYQISKHHGRLNSFEEFADNICSRNLNNALNSIEKLKIPGFEFYILNKLLFSLLISSDYYATTKYMADLEIKDFGLLSDSQVDSLVEKFESYNIIDNIKLFEARKLKFKDNDINRIRTEIFLESEQNLKENFNKNIFYLEAPTGSGKTITSINLGLKLLKNDKKLNKLFYIFPFNTLVEQTKKTFNDIFTDSDNIEVINSITPIKSIEQEETETKYEKSYLNRLFFHSPILLTTHISLFNILFGTSKEDNYPLWQLANSVVIIDEIQSYNNNLWWYMISFFQKYAKILNIKIIIMSATLPKLDTLLKNNSDFIDLIKNRKYYFENKLFKERVSVDFSLLNGEEFQKSDELRIKRFEKLLCAFNREKESYMKFLFEFIKKDTAREFYDILNNIAKEFEIYELTGDDNKAYREFVISKTKENSKIIVVATQVIEAGVDIDMDIGFKDISTLDSEEQFMGRVNRNCKKENSKVYFFYLDDEQKIYRGDNRLEFNLRKKEYQRLLKEKKFQEFYKIVLNRIGESGNSIIYGLNSEIENFRKNVSNLNYKEISKIMTLINSQNYTLFFPFKIDITRYEIKEFKYICDSLLTNGFLDGSKVWDKFKELNDIEKFSERKVKISRINSLMKLFSFNIIKYGNGTFPCDYTEEIVGIYYIENYNNFITNDLKFKRKEFQEKCKSIFY